MVKRKEDRRDTSTTKKIFQVGMNALGNVECWNYGNMGFKRTSSFQYSIIPASLEQGVNFTILLAYHSVVTLDTHNA